MKWGALFTLMTLQYLLGGTSAFGGESLNEAIKSFNKGHSIETAKIKKAVNQGGELQGSEFSKDYKELLYSIYAGYASRLENAQKMDSAFIRDTPLFEFFKKALEKLEYREDEVDATSDRIRIHLVQLEEKRYRIKWRTSVHYLSWQSQASLIGPFETTNLLSTNLGVCPGIGASLENRYWSLSLDLNGLYGSGGVSAVQGIVEYQQSQVPAIGGRLAVGGGRIVSSSGSELGLRASALYVRQTLSRPSDTQYSIEQNKTLSFTASIFSRWRFNRFYIETDFGRTIARPSTLWSLGFGAIL